MGIGPFTNRLSMLDLRRQQSPGGIGDHDGLVLPAFPDNVYDRSNPFTPQTFLSQPLLSREPTIDTRQSPVLSVCRPGGIEGIPLQTF
jgi:hypothetical protein